MYCSRRGRHPQTQDHQVHSSAQTKPARTWSSSAGVEQGGCFRCPACEDLNIRVVLVLRAELWKLPDLYALRAAAACRSARPLAQAASEAMVFNALFELLGMHLLAGSQRKLQGGVHDPCISFCLLWALPCGPTKDLEPRNPGQFETWGAQHCDRLQRSMIS